MLVRIVEQQRAILLANVDFKFELPDFDVLSEIISVLVLIIFGAN